MDPNHKRNRNQARPNPVAENVPEVPFPLAPPMPTENVGMVMRDRPEPIAIRKARFATAYAALTAVRFERHVPYDACEAMLNALAGAFGRLDLEA